MSGSTDKSIFVNESGGKITVGIGITDKDGKAGRTGGTESKTSGVKCDGVIRPSVFVLNRPDAVGCALDGSCDAKAVMSNEVH